MPHSTIEASRMIVPAFLTYSLPRSQVWMPSPRAVGMR